MTGRFAYGLRVHGLDRVTDLMPAPPGDDLPEVTIRQHTGPRPVPEPLDRWRQVRLLADGRHLAVDRRSGTATFHGPPLTPDLLAHPYLAAPAVVVNRWTGRETFHAGTFVRHGRAFAVLGSRTAGKSSLLAALAARDVPVLADDVAVVHDGGVFAGPRCIDLRQPVPGLALPGRTAREGSRTRVSLPPVATHVPLAGWIFLSWGPGPALARLPAADALGRLAAERSWPQLPSDPAVLLTLAALPAWELTRPREWGALEATCRLVESAAEAAAGQPA
ncbi:hypothetical protein MRQ36_20675 [Micromonospora sp. R77]|uniref:hypothetical protein n=1 Tax=Micromonospora sp. R77 TaxID=2925836 RepID=UPI001F62191F|nr:hypothetical protein [Micromonospora sp. R77]MCI4064849.1 hypothetical protein [Micromonospora sp. R77]